MAAIGLMPNVPRGTDDAPATIPRSLIAAALSYLLSGSPPRLINCPLR
jgi:hypothetical protein